MQYTHLKPLFFIPVLLVLISGAGRHDILIDKYYENARDPAFKCVGELFVKKEAVSSCVLIGKRYVMTAAHSVRSDSRKLVKDSIITPVGMRPIKRPAYSYTTDAALITLKFDNRIFRCKQVFIHPLYNDSFRSEALYDIAILELEEEITGIEIPGMYNGELINKPGIAAGCGEAGSADDYNGQRKYKQLKMAGENMIDSVTDLTAWSDMDHPDSVGYNRMGSDKPLPLEWIGLAGDCGGPLFIKEGTSYSLAGISFAPAYFTDMYYFGKLKGTHYGFITGWTKISAIQEWIGKTIPH